MTWCISTRCLLQVVQPEYQSSVFDDDGRRTPSSRILTTKQSSGRLDSWIAVVGIMCAAVDNSHSVVEDDQHRVRIQL